MNLRTFMVASIAGAAIFSQSSGHAQAAVTEYRVAPAQAVNFSVHLPLRNGAELAQLIHNQSAPGSPLYHHFLSPAQFRAAFGPSAQTLAAATAALRSEGFTIDRVATQLISVHGSAAAVQRAFSTQLVTSSTNRFSHIRAGARMTMPARLAATGAVVAGLANRLLPQPEFKKADLAPDTITDNRYSKLGPYWYTDLKQAYNYPAFASANGTGVTIATVGYSDFSTVDAKDYFEHEKLGLHGYAKQPQPNHVVLPGSTAFNINYGISDEADLDVQQAGGSAPGATIDGLSLGGAGEAFLDAYSYLDEYNFADIVSTSYGECELYYTAAYNDGVDYTDVLKSYHELFAQGNAEGITFVFSSGDDAGLGCLPLGYFGPPANKLYHPIPGSGIWVDDPDVTAVGGTNLITDHVAGLLFSEYATQDAFGDEILTPTDPDGTGNLISDGYWGSGSGTSVVFAAPSYQKLVKTGSTMRVMPDVAMHMGGCPYEGPGVVVACDLTNRDSADLAYLAGSIYGLIGTSASAPEFAGLLAVKESVVGSRLGNVNELMYAEASKPKQTIFRQGIPGFNGVFRQPTVYSGYSPILGLGTPIGIDFVGLPTAPQAGDPQTVTNP